MEPKDLVGLADQFALELRERLDPRVDVDPGPRTRAPREVEVQPMVTRFGLAQAAEERAERRADRKRPVWTV